MFGHYVSDRRVARSRAAELTLQGVQGNTTALLFWNPPCAFCQRMLPKLVAWEKDTPRGAPKLVVVSAGARAVNEPADFRSTVLFDATSSLSREFRVSGTPSAVLVDRRWQNRIGAGCG